jgi:hypothetical protein
VIVGSSGSGSVVGDSWRQETEIGCAEESAHANAKLHSAKESASCNGQGSIVGGCSIQEKEICCEEANANANDAPLAKESVCCCGARSA